MKIACLMVWMIVCLSLPLAFGVASAQSVATGNRPNIVFAFADDLGCYASCYRDGGHGDADPDVNRVLQTPNIDRVAATGMQFQNAFVSSPSCTPSRAAIVAARHFFRNGSHSQLHHPWYGDVVDPWDEVKGFPLILQDVGYHIGWSYKMHLSEDRMGGKQRNYVSSGKRFNSFSQIVMEADDRDAMKQQLLDEVDGNFEAFLGDRDEDQPYFYWFNPTNTHRSWAKGSGKALWGINPDDLEGQLPSFLPDNEIIREDFADYLGEAMAFDAAVGVLLDKLESRGELENTIFVVSGDHGAPGFPRGKCNLYDFGAKVPLAIQWPAKYRSGSCQQVVSLIDLGPTFLKAAGCDPTPDMDGQSLHAYLNADSRADKPRADESTLRDHVIIGREQHVDEARPGGLSYPMRAIRTADYLYIVNFKPDRWPVAAPPLDAPLRKSMKKGAPSRRRMDMDFGPTRDFFVRYADSDSIQDSFRLGFGKRPAEELYQVGLDPDQVTNMIDVAPEIRDRLRDQLISELRRGGDPRVVGDDAFDRPPYNAGDAQAGIPRKTEPASN